MKIAILLLASLILSANAQAADTAGDTKVIANFLNNYVYELDQPVYVWSWYTVDGRTSVWKSPISATDYAGYAHLESTTARYLNSFCTKNAALNPSDCPAPSTEQYGVGNMYGPGLYFALDPVATASYGGSSTNGWVLMQVHFPKGFRIMDIRRDGSMTFPMRLQRNLIALGCPKEWATSSQGLDQIFRLNNDYNGQGQGVYNSSTGQNVKLTISDQCLLAMRKMLKDDLQIDAFFYSYNSTEFKECDLPPDQNNSYGYNGGGNNPNRQGAFVMVKTDQLNPRDVRVFNSGTRDDKEDRIRIESLFYKTDVDSQSTISENYYKKMSFPNNPGYSYSGLTSKCDTDSSGKYLCKQAIYLCSDHGGGCITIEPPSLPPTPVMATQISKDHPPGSSPEMSANGWYSRGTDSNKHLLWPDIDGESITPDLNNWTKENLFGCKADAEYQ